MMKNEVQAVLTFVGVAVVGLVILNFVGPDSHSVSTKNISQKGVSRAEFDSIAAYDDSISNYNDSLRVIEENNLYAKVKKLPSSDVNGNYLGYQKLYSMDQSNKTYREKYIFYKNKKDDAEREKALAAEKQRTKKRIENAYCAYDLSYDCARNTVGHERDFTGRTMTVKGVIDRMDYDLSGNPYIELEGHYNRDYEIYHGPDLKFFFSKANIDEISRLAVGQKIVITGKFEGNLVGDLCFRNCRIEATSGIYGCNQDAPNRTYWHH